MALEFVASLLATVCEGYSHGHLMFDAQIAAVCCEYGVNGILMDDSECRQLSASHIQRDE